MKTVGLEQTSLDSCVIDAQQERLVVTREGKPVALVIGINAEQLEYSTDDVFWKLIEGRRKEETVSRNELEKLIETTPPETS